MDIIGDERSRLERAAAWLDATRAELLGLAVLLAGAVLATGLLWWTMAGPHPMTAEVTGVGTGPDPVPDASVAGEDVDLDTDASAAPDEPEGPDELTVHVTGAVQEAGIVVVPSGARVADALEAAGGTTGEAQLHRLNLARPVDDGEQIHVPREGEQLPPQATREGDEDGPVDLNRADAASLERLPGIGPALAAAIIEHRETHGPFARPGDLRDVSGIGEATFQRLAELVTTS